MITQLATATLVPKPTVTKIGLIGSMNDFVAGDPTPTEVATVVVRGTSIHLRKWTLMLVDPLDEDEIEVPVDCYEYVDTILLSEGVYTVYTMLVIDYPRGQEDAGQWSNNPDLVSLHSVGTGELSQVIGDSVELPEHQVLQYDIVIVGLPGVAEDHITVTGATPKVVNSTVEIENAGTIVLRAWQSPPLQLSELVQHIVKRGHTLYVFTRLISNQAVPRIWNLGGVAGEAWYDKENNLIDVANDEPFYTAYTVAIIN